MSLKEKKISPEGILRIIEIAIAATLLIVLALAFSNIQKNSSETGTKRLEESIHRSVMSCYAMEGIYPPNVEYLTEHYGLQIDESRYVVQYSVFADNIMPDITVIKKS